MILINVAIIVAYIVFSKSSILIQNANLQAYNTKLNKNIQEKTDLAVMYDRSVAKKYGGRYTELIACPSSVTLSGSVNQGIINSMQPYVSGSDLYCSGSIGSNTLLLQYDSSGMAFSTGILNATSSAAISGTTIFS